MGDTTYMRMTVYDCPVRLKTVATVLAEYVNIDTDQVEPGVQYTVDETSVGNIRYLARNLIADAPRCSFIGWEDPGTSDGAAVLGGLIAYTPKLGRFDGECTGSGDVVLNREQTGAVLKEAIRRGWGLSQAFDVAYGKPWRWHADGGPLPRRELGRWTKVIDTRYDDARHRHDARLSGLALQVSRLGLAGHAGVVLNSGSDQPGDVEARLDDVRAVADECEAVIRGLPEPLKCPQWRVPHELRAWANDAETPWQGRRRP